ncbi:MAG: amino acid adenylation domain-containing protein, partial [Trebonia sp.]
LVAAQAARTPEATAVVYGEAVLTYHQLDHQARQIAESLRRHFGVRAGDLVGVMLDRSERIAVALLGILYAGAAYVPINPRHPWDTVGYMLDNAGVTVLVVDAGSIGPAAQFRGQLLVMDLELRGSASVVDSPVPVSGNDLAYVIYTSGSTGRPKGVAVEHRAIVNTILWRNAFYGLTAADVNLQIPSFSFDSSVVDIFCVLSAGGVLLVPDEDIRLDAARLQALCVRHGVTTCVLTPSYYSLLVGELREAARTLRAVTLAGETATADLVAAHLAHLPGVALFNEYGPTENAVCSTACRLDRAEPTVSIGRPIANVQVRILDAGQRLCAIGVPGEIHLGGAGLARGYINQPSLTAERFVPSPVPGDDGLLYRTGDRAAWREDGAIEFLGRFDNQVKIRGFRIELDEVELVLLRHPGVRSAAVLCKDDPAGGRYLAAYADVRDASSDTALREYLRGRLPYYMVPDVIAVLPRLPLTVSGKVDRRSLHTRDDFAGEAAGVAMPLSPLQVSLLGL